MTISRPRALLTGLACWVIVSSPFAALHAEEPAAARARPRYELIDLGIPYASVTAGINDKGQIVGTNTLSPTGPGLGYLWKDGHFQYIPAVGGTNSQAAGLNERGEVVGSAQNTQNTYIGMLYRQGESEALPITLANGINNHGQIVGISNTFQPFPDVQQVAQLYQDGTVTDLGNLGGLYANATGINERGEIVGESSTTAEPASPFHAFIYRRGKMTDLGTLGGLNTTATAINSRGIVTGVAELPQSTAAVVYEDAFLYRSGRLIDLGVVGSDFSSNGMAINDSDDVVGMSTTGTGSQLAMIYTHGKMWHLQDLVEPSSTLASHVNLYQATGINNDGWIAVNGYDTDNMAPPNTTFGLPRSYLLRPIR
jgi:probable HAF family extracellular repeat protein